ncbi:virulence RhuM family protein [Niabella sp. CC-SYL272]|uniref:virulence RhuM family protein n=1 Tax=Niabella agricola TaxID=2891571 RepID=UPI001F33DB79|nr:virulence RhuM family protein [Niabella agricola]MCF3110987.1 virulence RhuM family protein [Niabella agricola]
MESEILIYQTEGGDTRIEVRLESEDVWLSQTQMCTLYQKSKSSISEHLTDIFKTGELDEDSVVRKYRTTAADGKMYNTKFYNLDVIISVGYRVDSHRGIQFRKWATQRLKEYLIKGFTLDDERLKSGNQPNYFQELLDRIRDIRSTERIFYEKVKEIYATSIDYDRNAATTQAFFASVQNKLHWAVHSHTAAELIYKRASADKPNMGLTTWKGDKLRKTDVTIAKNYLTELELKELNLLVEQYLAFAETQALRQVPMYMKDWAARLHDILTINQKEIKLDAGRISKKIADELAEKEYEKFDARRKEIEAVESLKLLEDGMKKIGKVQ